jgi:hypothetical protein
MPSDASFDFKKHHVNSRINVQPLELRWDEQ